MSLICWWPLNGDTKNYGTLGGEVEAAASSPVYTNGKIGQALYTGALSLTAEQWQKIIGNTISIAMWIYTRDDGSYGAGTPFFGNAGMTKPNNRKFAMFHYPNKTALHCSWQHDDLDSTDRPNTYVSVSYNDFFEIGKWIHLCVVQDAATETVTIYRNGTQYSKISVSGLATMNFKSAAAAPIRNGINYQHTNDIRIYDHALSELEIKELSKGLILHYNFNQLCSTNVCNWRDTNTISMAGHGGIKTYEDGVLTLTAKDGWQAFMWDIGADNVGKTVTLSFEYYVSEIHDNDYIYLQTYSSAWYGAETKRLDKTVTTWTKEYVTFPSANQFVGFNVRGVDSSGDSLTIKVRNVKIVSNSFDVIYSEYNETTKVIDESGYGHHAIVYNGFPSNDSKIGSRSCYTPRFLEENQNTHANSSNASYIYSDIFGYNFTPDEFTLAFWWKPVSWGNGSGPFGLVIGVTDYLNSTVGVHDGSARINFSDGSTNTRASCGFTGCGTGVWSHYVITGKPGMVKSYINGIEKTSAEIGSNLTLDPWRYLYLGACSAGGVLRDGDIYWSDVRYYTTALSQKDVIDLYNVRGYLSDNNSVFIGELIETGSNTSITDSSIFEAKEFYEDSIMGYDIIEYIESAGAQYIDTEYITTSADYSYEIDMAWTGSGVGNFESFMGYMHSSQNPRAAIHKYSSVLMFGGNATTTSSVAPVKNERFLYKGRFKSGDQKLYKNGELIASNSTGFDHSDNTLSTYIFARNNSGRNYAYMRLYEAKIYEGENVVRHYIPARRRSDNALGLYETTQKQFFINKGSGSFTASGITYTNENFSIYEGGHSSANEFIEF